MEVRINDNLQSMRAKVEDIRARAKSEELAKFGLLEEAEAMAVSVFAGTATGVLNYRAWVREMAGYLRAEQEERRAFSDEQRNRFEQELNQ